MLGDRAHGEGEVRHRARRRRRGQARGGAHRDGGTLSAGSSEDTREGTPERAGPGTLRTYADLACDIARATGSTGRRDRRPFLVAVDGGGGSGKSTFARPLAGELARVGVVAVVPVDDFYRPPGEEGPEPEGLFDLARLRREVISTYLAGEPASYRPFDWDAGGVSREARLVGSPDVLIVEGVFATSPLLGERHHLGVWVDAPRAIRLERGLARDGEAARATWTGLWMPREDRYFEGTRPDVRADLVVDAGRPSPPGTYWRR